MDRWAAATEKVVKTIPPKPRKFRNNFLKAKNINLGRKLTRLEEKSIRATVSMIRRIIKFNSFIKSIPITLASKDPSKDRLLVKQFESTWRLALTVLVFVCIQGTGLFRVGSFLSYAFVTDINFVWSIHLLLVLLSWIASVIYIAIFMYSSAVVEFFNQTDFLIETISKEQNGKFWYANPFVMLLVNGITSWLASTVITVAPVILGFFPDAPFFTFSYLPDELRAHWELHLLFVIIETVYIIYSTAIITAIVVFVCSYVFQTLILFDELKEKLKAMEIAGIFFGSVRMYETHMVTCRELKIHSIMFNDFIRDFFAPAIFSTMIGISVFCLYITLTAFDYLPWYAWVIFPIASFFLCVVQIFLYLYIASLSIRSEDVLTHMKRLVMRDGRVGTVETDFRVKSIEAMKPCVNNVGFFGYVSIGYPQEALGQIFDFLLLMLSF